MSFESVTVKNDTGKDMPYFTYNANGFAYLSRHTTEKILRDGHSLSFTGIVDRSPNQRMFSNQSDFFSGKSPLFGYITITTRDDTVYEVPESSINKVREHRTPIIKYGGSVGNAQKAVKEKMDVSLVYGGKGEMLSTYEHKPEYVFSTRVGKWFVNKDSKNPLSFIEVLDIDVPDSNFTITYQFRAKKSLKKAKKSAKKSTKKSTKKSKKSAKKSKKSTKKAKK